MIEHVDTTTSDFFDVKEALSKLSMEDRMTMKQVYYNHFTTAAKTRFEHVMVKEKMDFNVFEKRYLARAFIFNGVDYILNYNAKHFDQLEKKLYETTI